MARRITLIESHPDLVSDWWGSNFTTDPAKITASSVKKVNWVCPEYGHTFEAAVRTVAKYQECYVCSGKTLLRGVNDLATLCPRVVSCWDEQENEKEPSQVRAKSQEIVHIVCEEGHKFSTQARTLLRGHWCKYCAGIHTVKGVNDITVTRPDLLDLWDYAKNYGIDPSDYKRGSHKKVWWKCREGHSWLNTIHNVGNGSGCPTCAGMVLEKGKSLGDLYPELVPEWSSDNDKSPYEVFRQSNEDAKWVCANNPDHTWTTKIYSRTGTDPTGCPTCFQGGSSTAQQEMTEFIRNNAGHIETDYVGLCRGKRHVDVYVPSKNVAFEFNGLYWHSDAPGIKSAPVVEKEKDCAVNGVDLYVVWEDDWRDRREIVEKWIRSVLGTRDQDKVNARQCHVRGVSKQESREFLNAHHIQGNKDGSVRVGLYLDNTLVAMAVFTRAETTLRLERYATSANVRGGFTKLISWVDRNIHYTTMETFADLTYSKGKLYEENGWAEVGRLKPDYSYRFRDRRVHKFNYRVSRFKEDPTLKYEEGRSERELALLNKLYRVYDAGKIKYTRSNPSL